MALISTLYQSSAGTFKVTTASETILAGGVELAATGTITIGTQNSADVTIGNSSGSVSIDGDLALSSDLLRLRDGEAAAGTAGFAIERGSTGDDLVIGWDESSQAIRFGLADTSSGYAQPPVTALIDLWAGGLQFRNSGGATLDSTNQSLTIDATGQTLSLISNSYSIEHGGTTLTWAGSKVTPDASYDLGDSTDRFNDLYLDGDITMTDTTITDSAFSASGGNYTISADGGILFIGNASYSSGGAADGVRILGNQWTDAGTPVVGGAVSIYGGATANGQGGSVEINSGTGTTTDGGFFVGNRADTDIYLGVVSGTTTTDIKAGSDINFQITGVASAISMFASGDTNGLSLTGFTATSIVGAIQENRASVAAISATAPVQSTYTAGEALIEGNLVYISASGECSKAGYSTGNYECIGATDAAASSSASVTVNRAGTAAVAMAGGLTLSVGDEIYLTDDGLGTNVEPTLSSTGEASVFVGYIKTTDSYSIEGDTVTVELVGPEVLEVYP